MKKNICVFCSSSNAIDLVFIDMAKELGCAIAKNNCTLVYGGANVGLMHACATAVQKNGGRVVGVIPEKIRDYGLAYDNADELIVTKDLRERKAIIEKRSDVVVALPGSFGTLEEVMEVIALKQLKFYDKPIVLMNTNGFYDRLLRFFETFYEEKFAKSECRQLYYLAKDVDDLFAYLKDYKTDSLEKECF